MRRKASLVLLACAVFCAAPAPLVRWYAFPRLARIPANQYQDMVLPQGRRGGREEGRAGRNCAAAPCSAVAPRSPRSPGT
ncbi:porin PorA family protein [Streptomyces olivaceoviridis]|uniref:porin PorA family protein n=1 Tax=Streptomyces olivaceoviridis TaxID=1921 RepID=UPI003681D4DB